MRAWENANFGPPARNRQKIAEKSILASPGKLGKDRPKIGNMARKPIFEPFFLFCNEFFPYFPGEARIDCSAIFSDFGILPGTHSRKKRGAKVTQDGNHDLVQV